MTYLIRPEEPYTENHVTQFPTNKKLKNKIEKKKSIIQKNSKQSITNKRMRIKIEIQNKFYIWLKGEIEKKNELRKRT